MPTLDTNPDDDGSSGSQPRSRVEDEVREILERTSFGDEAPARPTLLKFPTKPSAPKRPTTISPLGRIGMAFMFGVVGALFSIEAPPFAWVMGVASFLCLASLWMPQSSGTGLPPRQSLEERFDQWRRGR